jgi:cytochrome c2
MAVRLAFLIFLLTVPYVSAATRASVSCLKCHQSHYEAVAPCVSCHLGDDRTVRKEIAHLNLAPGRLVRYRIPGDLSAELGTRVLETFACRRCHKIYGKGNSLASNLDNLAGVHPSRILESILKPVVYMPDFRFDLGTASLLVNAIAKAAESNRKEKHQAPKIVRFDNVDKHFDNIFEKYCGGCHRILTKAGAFGRGNIGPNLSGLMGEHYPKTYVEMRQWDEKRLEKWIKNPRAVKENARMQPISIENHQLNQLLFLLNAR